MKIGYRPPKSPVFRGMLRKSGVSPGFGRFWVVFRAVCGCMALYGVLTPEKGRHHQPRCAPPVRTGLKDWPRFLLFIYKVLSLYKACSIYYLFSVYIIAFNTIWLLISYLAFFRLRPAGWVTHPSLARQSFLSNSQSRLDEFGLL